MLSNAVKSLAAFYILLACVESKCKFTTELMFAQDFSHSFRTHVRNLKSHLPDMYEHLNKNSPDSRFGLSSFIDKPLIKFGWPYQGPWATGDWCLNVTSTIQPHANPSDEVENLFSKKQAGGHDWPENQLGVLHDIARHDSLAGWSNRIVNQKGVPVVKVVLMSTDSPYHVAGDGANSRWTLRSNDGDGTTECEAEDYPTIKQVSNALKDRKVYTVFFTDNDKEDIGKIYKELLTKIKTPGEVYKLNNKSSNFSDQWKKAVKDLTSYVCDKPTLDIVFAQDTSWSYTNDMPHLHEKLKAYMKLINETYIASRFGLVTFVDKPLMPLGHGPSGDYCYKLHQDLSHDTDMVTNAAKTLKLHSGRDWKESQLDALITTSLDPAVNWRKGNKWKGYKLHRILVLATDSGFHVEGDAKKAGYDLAAHAGKMVNCLNEDYPSEQQVFDVLKKNKIRPLFVPTSDMYIYYRRLLERAEKAGVVGEVVELKNFDDLPSVVTYGVRKLTEKLDLLEESPVVAVE